MGRYLEALKVFYGTEENTTETLEGGTDKTIKSPFVGSDGSTSGHIRDIQAENEQIPFADHEIAEHKISNEVHRDDRSFVRQQLIGAYGSDRLDIVNQYLEQLEQGFSSVKETHKKSNVGRKRANTWLREKGGK